VVRAFRPQSRYIDFAESGGVSLTTKRICFPLSFPEPGERKVILPVWSLNVFPLVAWIDAICVSVFDSPNVKFSALWPHVANRLALPECGCNI
jgi:hypothetical protein